MEKHNKCTTVNLKTIAISMAQIIKEEICTDLRFKLMDVLREKNHSTLESYDLTKKLLDEVNNNISIYFKSPRVDTSFLWFTSTEIHYEGDNEIIIEALKQFEKEN